MMTGQAWVNIMQKSDTARFTTNMLDGVLRVLTWTETWLVDRAGHQTHLQEDVDDTSISENVDEPEEKV